MKGKKILVGITGGIAAYKTAYLVREFIKAGFEVKVLMTKAAKTFITPLTMATLSKNPVLTDFFNPENGDWNSHVELGLWADAMIIAPATANSMAKMAHGIADNLLLTTYLSVKCPVFFAPAMDLDMFQHPSTQQNMTILKNRGHIFIDATKGELASGLSGKGRMAEPLNIYNRIQEYFSENSSFANKSVLVTAGPTYEAIDPVRFIGNHSSGKMGYAIANEFSIRGAKVILVSGPVHIDTPIGVQKIAVTTAEEMFQESVKYFPKVDIAVMSAAVADYTPKNPVIQKVKRKEEQFNIELKATKDIAEALGKLKRDNQVLLGFALETDNELENASLKLEKKKLDFIVLNSLNDEGAGFLHDTNKITIVDKYNNIEKYELKSKKKVATDIVNKIEQIILSQKV